MAVGRAMKNEKRNSQSTKWEYDEGDKVTTRDSLYKMMVVFFDDFRFVRLHVHSALQRKSQACVHGNLFHTPLCI
jgi:hypothetical protein